jgi:transposase
MHTTDPHTHNLTVIDWKARALIAESALAEKSARVDYLEAQLRLQRAQKFGSSSERTVSGQQLLDLGGIFNEAEATADPQAPESDLTHVRPHKRKKKKRHRDELLSGLPENIIHHQLSEEERVCSCCGHQRQVIREEISRELHVVPAQFSVDVHVTSVYGPCHCENQTTPIITASRPQRPSPNSIASPSAIAYTMDQKFTMGIPLYRQEQQWKRNGVDISRQTLSNWVVGNALMWLFPIWLLMKQYLLKQDIIKADETTIAVINVAGEIVRSKSYMWLYRSSGRAGPEIILLDYQPTRQGVHPANFLTGFKGYLQTDGYIGYDQVNDVIRLGCWSHGRRGFTDAIKAAGGELKAPRAVEGREFCNRLFELERDWALCSPQERYELRLLHSKPLLDDFLSWLQETKDQSSSQTYLGRAVKYCLNQWTYLTNFLLDGRLDIDNNASERSIKSYVISRKNFLFCQTEKGAQASAITFSIIESAKANGLKPFQYLEHLLTNLPNATTKQLDEFLPWSKSIPDHCRSSK